jgi:hypothetical protein
MTKQRSDGRRAANYSSGRKLHARRERREPSDGVLVVTSRKPQQPRRLTQMLIAGFTALRHPRGRWNSQTADREQPKYCAGEDDHGSKHSCLTCAADQCTGRSLKGAGGEYATARAATNYNTKSNFAQPQGPRCNGGGWTCQAMKRCSTTASSRTSLKGMASRQWVHRQPGGVVDPTKAE